MNNTVDDYSLFFYFKKDTPITDTETIFRCKICQSFNISLQIMTKFLTTKQYPFSVTLRYIAQVFYWYWLKLKCIFRCSVLMLLAITADFYCKEKNTFFRYIFFSHLRNPLPNSKALFCTNNFSGGGEAVMLKNDNPFFVCHAR